MAKTTNKKLLKIILIAITIIAVFVGGTVTFLVITVNQEMIKNKAIQLVHNRTGRELKIDGDVSWTFFPWLGVKMQNISISNHLGFKEEYFAKAGELSANIKLLPLVFRRIEIGQLTLKNLNLKLNKNKLGKNNWQDILISDRTSVPTTSDKVSKFTLEKFTIGSLAIDNGSVLWHDEQADKKISINKFDLHCKNINFERPFDIATSFYLDNLNSSLNGRIIAKAHITLDTAKGLYEFKGLQLTGKLKNKTADNSFDLNGNANIKLDLKEQAVSVENLKLNIAQTTATGSFKCTKYLDNPIFSGDLAINSPDSNALMQLLGINNHIKKDTHASFKIKIVFISKVIKLPEIEAHLDDMILQGNAEYNLDKISFNLSLNKLDFDTFSSKVAKTPKTATTSAKAHTTSSSPTSPKAIKLNGNLKIGIIQANKLHINNLNTMIAGDTKQIICQNMGFDFYHGEGYGNVIIDTQSSAPIINLKLSLALVPMQTLLKEFANYEKFSGTLNLHTNINLNSLSGDGNIWITHGSYYGVDIPYEVRRAHAIVNMKPQPTKSQPPHTDFDKLTMNFKMTNGLLNTNDLLIQAPDYKVTGQGNANLNSKQLNLTLSAYSTHDENFFVPVKLRGAFTDPSVRIDTTVMLQRAVTKAVKDVIKNQLEKQLKNLPEDIKKILPF